MLSIEMEAATRLPTAIVLPADTCIPLRRQDGETTGQETYEWQTPFANRFIELDSDEDRQAWFHFCLGHHMEFLYWEASRHACEQTSDAIQAGDEAALDRWLDHVTDLVRGSGAMLYFCGALDAETYDRCLRPSMESARDDFSGSMSRDFLAMMKAKAALVSALESTNRADVVQRFRDAERVWFKHHADVIQALHPGKSLLRKKVARLVEEVEDFDYHGYVDNVVHGEQALSDYDGYFGVTRSTEMTLDEYWTQMCEKLASVHSGFAMDAEKREELMVGDAALVRMASQLLEAERRFT